jgi:hypothetical protein
MLVSLLAFFASFERKRIIERTKAGMERARREVNISVANDFGIRGDAHRRTLLDRDGSRFAFGLLEVPEPVTMARRPR